MGEFFLYAPAHCEDCGAEIPIIHDVRNPREGSMVVECPECRHSFTVTYEVTNLTELSINEIIKSKAYLEASP